MLPAFVAALDPMTSQVAGLAGAPVRVQLGRAIPQEISDGFRIANPTISGSPPVLYLSVYSVLLVQTNTNFNNLLRLEVANTVIAAVIDGSSRDSPAQQAITEALLINAEVPGSGPAVPGSGLAMPGVREVAHRFAALSAAARHTWLATHLTALRAGRISLSELP